MLTIANMPEPTPTPEPAEPLKPSDPGFWENIKNNLPKS